MKLPLSTGVICISGIFYSGICQINWFDINLYVIINLYTCQQEALLDHDSGMC